MCVMFHFSHAGILYNCRGLENSCSSCLGLNVAGFTCGWCSDEQCTVTEECSVAFSTTTDLCPPPTINSIHPSRGPKEGGTHVIITGTNLGAAYSDILEVRLHSEAGTSVECQLAGEETYLFGQQIVCVSPPVSDAGEYTLNARIQRESDVVNVSAPYFIKQPQLMGVDPQFGPQSGGIELIISGVSLDIGNSENTTACLNGIHCAIRE